MTKVRKPEAKVVYREWHNGTVTAVFLDRKSGPYCFCYESRAKWLLMEPRRVVSNTKPAPLVKAEALSAELARLGIPAPTPSVSRKTWNQWLEEKKLGCFSKLGWF